MLEKLIRYFINRHILTNLVFIAVFAVGIFSWTSIKKEEMPDVTFDFVRVSASYPGATAEEVEHFVTKELEDMIKGVDGVHQVTSTSSQGSASVSVEIEQDYPNKDEAITEIRNAVLDARLPDEVREEPRVRVFKTTKKAILDVALINRDYHLLDKEGRSLLQQYAIALENQLLNLPHVNSINRSGYRSEEIQINVDPAKLRKYEIPLSQVSRAVSDNHSRQPAGHVEAKNEPNVTINAQLDTVEKLNKLYIQAGFEGQAIPLSEIAEVKKAYPKEKQISKVNGHESIMLNVVKNTSYGILDSIEAVKETVEKFRADHLQGTPLDIVMLDDESLDVKNRLSIIATNGGIGFIFILVTLLLFLSRKSGLWVGIGIPFTICFTLVLSKFLGYTINNITLAAVIIVMGIVVDDAIVIAENINRMRSDGMGVEESAVHGTAQVFMPVMASVITTCIAFIPLYFFSGRFGRLNYFIPPIIFIMLGASLFESLFILPGHMTLGYKKENDKAGDKKKQKIHWFVKVEDAYGKLLARVLPYKYIVMAVFVLLLVLSGLIVKNKMKYTMFPREETREIVVSGELPRVADRYDSAEISRLVEAVAKPYIGKEIVGIRTGIARSRRGGAVEENKFRTVFEIVPKEKRKKSADQLVAMWKKEIDKIEGMEEYVIQKSRWGHSSGSAMEVVVQENDDVLRGLAASKLEARMKEHPSLANVEIETPLEVSEYRIDFKREKLKRLSISPSSIALTFRVALEGLVLYELPKGDEEIDVRLSVRDQDKTDIEKILDIPVENNRSYLVPLRDVINIQNTVTPSSIARRNYKRVTTVYADMKPGTKETPLDVAGFLEKNVFPEVILDQPSTALAFTGEVFDTRESQGDFKNAIIMVLLLIFAVLAVLYNSFTRPLIIMLAIPFGVIGVILAFWLHGKLVFGFFAAVGCLGLAGVVVNDSIVMVSKLEREMAKGRITGKEANEKIAGIAKTRLKAIVLTTVSTVAGVMPTAYGLTGYDAMLAEMMFALAWGLLFATMITLLLVPCLYSFMHDWKFWLKPAEGNT